VELVDRSDEIARIGVEGARAAAVVTGELDAPAPAVEALAPGACTDARIAGADAVVAAFAFGGGPALQLFVPAAAGAAARAALERAGALAGDAAALEVLRVEAGVPRMGAELSEEVLPPEARLEHAISYTKGCYTGQEIIARVRSRGQVAHLLVGLAPDDGAPLAVGAAIEAEGERVGEVTSAAVSSRLGPIALGYVRRAHAEPGTALSAAGRSVRVRALPFDGHGPV
jgi:folate-binding protein YgfZ